SSNPWHPFKHHAQYQLADFLFPQNETPQHQIDDLMDIWALMPEWGGHPPPFSGHSDVLEKIDSITGDPVWECLSVQCTDASTTSSNDPSVPAWKHASYDVWFRAPEALADLQLANPEFKDYIDYSSKQVFWDKHEHVWNNFMTENWAWRQCNELSEDPKNHGAMFVPLILGSDKTTVSVATGNNECHPIYLSIGNLHNNIQ
ncbi:hypothetical protein SCLCIDRAFT_126105, partial [Scleroderma citrinum Foug A]